MDGLSPPRIVCAANKYLCFDGTHLIVPSARHCDRTMMALVHAAQDGDCDLLTEIEQGFIDQHGRFYDRREAYKIAAANGQIRRRVGGDAANGGTLYSENLY